MSSATFIHCPMCILVLQIICEAHTKMLPDGRFTVSRSTRLAVASLSLPREFCYPCMLHMSSRDEILIDKSDRWAPVLLWSPHWNIPRVRYCEISCVKTEKSTLFYKTYPAPVCRGEEVRRVLPRVRGWVTPLPHPIYAAGPAKRQGLGVGSAGSQRRNGCVIMLLRYYHDDWRCENPTDITASHSPLREPSVGVCYLLIDYEFLTPILTACITKNI